VGKIYCINKLTFCSKADTFSGQNETNLRTKMAA